MNEVNDIINNLCIKLGTSIEYLAPEYAKMRIAESWAMITIAGVVFVLYLAFMVFIKKYVTKLVESGDRWNADEWKVIAIGISIVIFIVILCTACIAIPTIYKFNASPMAAFLSEILKQIK